MRGRYPGAPNKSFDVKKEWDELKEFEEFTADRLYSHLEKMLPPDLKKYRDGRLRGKTEFDTLQSAQLHMMMAELCSYTVMKRLLDTGKVDNLRDVAAVMGEMRQAMKDYEEMKRRRIELEEKIKRYANDNGVDTEAPESLSVKFENLLKQYQIEAEA